MAGRWLEERFVRAFAQAGIAVGGPEPWDLRVHNTRLWRRTALHGPAGFGDAYVDGWWDCGALDHFFDRAFRADLPAGLRFSPAVLASCASELLFNRQTRRRARRDVRTHYDLGNDLFEAMLDRRMVYSCALWDDARTLDQAQEAKLDLVCRKLGLRPGLSLLDIGCGWGGLVRFAAERYGCSVVGVTLSPAQAEFARTRCRGLPVEIRLQDYRDIPGRFDRIASVGMFEHVGPRNYRAFMLAVRRLLTRDGLALLHFFATQRSWPNPRDGEALWVRTHIFPGFVAPSLKQVAAAIDSLLVLEDVHNIGINYDTTLMAWASNFDRAWPSLRPRYGERFFRLWRYYLLCAAGAFRSRKYQVWQIALSPHGVPGGYRVTRAATPEQQQSASQAVTAPPSRRPAGIAP